MDILNLIGRTSPLFKEDVSSRTEELEALVSSSTFLVIGGAGSMVGCYARNLQEESTSTPRCRYQ